MDKPVYMKLLFKGNYEELLASCGGDKELLRQDMEQALRKFGNDPRLVLPAIERGPDDELLDSEDAEEKKDEDLVEGVDWSKEVMDTIIADAMVFYCELECQYQVLIRSEKRRVHQGLVIRHTLPSLPLALTLLEAEKNGCPLRIVSVPATTPQTPARSDISDTDYATLVQLLLELRDNSGFLYNEVSEVNRRALEKHQEFQEELQVAEAKSMCDALKGSYEIYTEQVVALKAAVKYEVVRTAASCMKLVGNKKAPWRTVEQMRNSLYSLHAASIGLFPPEFCKVPSASFNEELACNRKAFEQIALDVVAIAKHSDVVRSIARVLVKMSGRFK